MPDLLGIDYTSIKVKDGKFWNELTLNEKWYLTGFVDGYLKAKE